jgi:signal transduction histidine kinase
VQDLQDYAKITKPQLQEIDLEKTIQDVLESMNIPYTIAISYSLEKDFPKIITDQLYLKRILANLISNAVQAMPNDGGKIDVYSKYKDNEVWIIVADTGEGISNA